MVASPQAIKVPDTQSRVRAAKALRSMLLVLSVAGVLGIAAHFTLAIWAQNEFTQPESIVVGQVRMLNQGGTLYQSLRDYPYTVNAYMPVGYGLQSGLQKLGLSPYAAGRLISMMALLVLGWLVYRILWLYSSDRRCAWLGAALCGCTSGLPFWGTVGQMDMLAITLALAAFHQFSRYGMLRTDSLRWAIVLTVLAVFTKQTVLAAPAAILVALWLRDRRPALRFALTTGGVGIGLVLLANSLTHGSFLANTLYANINPFAWEKIEQHGSFWLIASGQLAIITGLGARQLWRRDSRPVLIYLGLAFLVLMLTAGKVGSDSNYQVESTVLLVIAACLSLHALGFFDLVFTGSRSRVPLLVMPLLLHVLLNVRLEIPNLIGRYAKELHFREQTTAVLGQVRPGQVLSADTNALIHLGRPIEVEPLIYRLLVEADRIDPARVTQDLAARRFATVILYHDLHRTETLHAEIPTLPAAQLAEIRRHYQRVAHIPGPYLGGLYLYKPKL